MKRFRPAILLPVVLTLGCAWLPRFGAPGPATEPFDIARMGREGLGDEDEHRPSPVLDHETREKLVRDRFPGARTLDLVRVRFWPAEPFGPCRTELAPPRDLEVSARYELTDGSDHEAGSVTELRRQGWRGFYRTPAGTGLELRAPLAAIDLSLETTFFCRCIEGEKVVDTEPAPLRVRVRWQGPGHHLEVGGRTKVDGRAVAPRSGYSTGGLVTYEYEARRSFPGRGPRCSAFADAALLVDPPIL